MIFENRFENWKMSFHVAHFYGLFNFTWEWKFSILNFDGEKKISEVWRDSRDNLFYNVTMTKTHVYLYEMLRKIDILLHWNLKDTVTSENPFRSRSSTEEKEQFFSELPLI